MLASAELTRPSNAHQDQHRHSIQQLPDQVLSQIRSSITINTLNVVVLELIRNSLDANATKIAVSLDFRRASCTVEDNGFGIWPSDFAASGGLGKLHHTSKYHTDADTFGRNGAFLASLSALSLLIITSRHHQHQSVNSLVLHNSRRILRPPPGPAQSATTFARHGTTVSVRDLFGSMPVRVKQRAAFEERAELDKLCNSLKREAVADILAYGKAIDLSIQHNDIGIILRLRRRLTADRVASGKVEPATEQIGTSALIQHSLWTLVDAGLSNFENRKAWIPVSASTDTIKVQGAISSEPAPNRASQFISLDGRPLTAVSGHNELYEEVNRIFSSSSFGSIDREQVIDNEQTDSRKNDRSSKCHGPTNKQLKCAHKGTDRWPMFFFHIKTMELKHSLSIPIRSQMEPKLRAVTEVLSAMVTQWLTSQKHRPRKKRKLEQTPDSTLTGSVATIRARATHLRFGSARPISNTGPAKSPLEPRPSYIGIRSFNELSRMKSGKASFYDSAWTSSLPMHKPKQALDSLETQADRNSGLPQDPIAEGQHGRTISTTTTIADMGPRIRKESIEDWSSAATNDETIIWQDPVSDERCLIDSRTGTMRPSPDSGVIADRTSTGNGFEIRWPSYARPWRTANPKTAKGTQSKIDCPQPSSWLQSFLRAWENPVFHNQEQRIPHINVEVLGHNCCTSAFGELKRPLSAGNPFNHEQIVVNAGTRLSKDGLLQASFIAQVDAKFILVRIPSTPSKLSTTINDTIAEGVLVLIDQHAADERIKVESLLGELCSPAESSQPRYRSMLGHMSRFRCALLNKPVTFNASESEVVLFRRYATHFARWSILYDIVDTTVKVTTLPSVVSERLKSSPQLIVDLLRSEVHTLEHNPRPKTSTSVPQLQDEPKERPTWLKLIDDCPTGLLDLVNSRACRSAIMFNDVLDKRQCQELLGGLARCIFPFMCAHGRPSMVPIVALGAGAAPDTGTTNELGRSNYAGAFRRWKALAMEEENQSA